MGADDQSWYKKFYRIFCKGVIKYHKQVVGADGKL